jgi:hypothetical protein
MSLHPKAVGITFDNVTVASTLPDGRPAYMVDTVVGLELADCGAARGTGQQWDVGVRGGSNITTPGSRLVVQQL